MNNDHILRLLICWICIGLSSYHLTAQKRSKRWVYDLQLQGPNIEARIRSKLAIPLQVKDSTEAIQETNRIIQLLHQQSFLRAEIHQFICKEDSCLVRIQTGDQIQWTYLKNGNLDPSTLQRFRIPELIYQNKPVYYLELIRLQEQIIRHLENNGYPFAKCWLDSFQVEKSRISAALFLDKGPFISYQEIELIPKENAAKKIKIKKGYLASYLNIKENGLYKESDIITIQRKMDNLTFVRSYRTPLIQFSEKEAKVQLFVEDKPSSRVDLLVGLLPAVDPITNQQRFDFTGNIHIDLLNPFGTGKQLLFKWQQVKEGISDVRVKLNWPYLLKVPLGLDLSFHLYKRDTSFIDIIGDLGVQYLFNGNSYVKVYYKPSITNIIQINAPSIIASRSLPSVLDFNNSNVGFQCQFSTLDYPISPQKGFRLFLDVDIGLKKVRRNQQILSLSDPNDTQFDFGSLYDSINTDYQRYSISLMYTHFFPLWSWSTIMAQIDAAIILSNQPLYTNELFRIGGSRRLRGFDEESILSSWYNIMTLEWRFLFNQNSYVYAFGDFCYMETKSIDRSVTDWPIGFGIGLALQTRVGLFGLTYALGGRTGNPISIRSGKVHFGYIYAF